MSDDRLVLAVDGGNSKTDIALLRDDGSVLAVVRGQGSSPHQLGLDRAVRIVDDLVERAWFESGLGARNGSRAEIAAVFMAGADLPAEEVALAEAVDAQGWARRSHVANDVFAVLWAATGSGVGVAVTVGAGVNCVGRSQDGRTAWFPALGPITGDWGGGSDIGMAALGAGVRSEDRRGPATALAQSVAGHFGMASALDVAVAIHQGRLEVARLLELPPLVIAAAAEGDGESLAILERQAEEVTVLAIAALRQLDMAGAAVDVVLGGSILAASGAMLMERIGAGITAVAPRARTSVCTVRPVAGAALAGLSIAGAPAGAADRARAELATAAEGATTL